MVVIILAGGKVSLISVNTEIPRCHVRLALHDGRTAFYRPYTARGQRELNNDKCFLTPTSPTNTSIHFLYLLLTCDHNLLY